MKLDMVKVTMAMLLLVFLIPAMAGAATGYQGVLLSPEKTLNTHELIDLKGNHVQFPSAAGKYQLAFFGYTSCTDVCPMTLHKIKQVMDSLENRQDVDFYFISIDVDRDEPQYLKNFLAYYHPDIKGLTGSIYNIKQVENEFGILTRKFQGKSALAYKLEHSVFMYLINRQGKLMLMYPGSATSTQIASDLNRLLASQKM